MEALLEVYNLVKHFPVRQSFFGKTGGKVHAVDGVSFRLPRGKTLGVVGESGSGKTTLGRLVLGLLEPTNGTVKFAGRNIFSLSREAMRALRRRMQIIFQDPYGSLNPRMTVGAMIEEALAIHRIVPKTRRRERVGELLEMVGLRPEHAIRYAHEFSGGQRQRIGIARALSVQPELIVADEPVSALDLSVQAQILNLMQELRERLGLSYLFIAHDLSVVEHVSDAVAVMYLGKIMELASTEDLFASPFHPYTRALLASVPVPDPSQRKEREPLRGDIPSPIDPPPGCPFAGRCSLMNEKTGSLFMAPICRREEPKLREKGKSLVACHLV